MSNLVSHGQQATNTTGNSIFRQRRIRVLSQFLQGRLLVLQTQSSRFKKMRRNVVAEDFEGTF